MSSASEVGDDSNEVDHHTPATRLRLAALTILSQQLLGQRLTLSAAQQLLVAHRRVDVALRAEAARLAPLRPRRATPDFSSPPVSAPPPVGPAPVIPASEARLPTRSQSPSGRAPVVQAMLPRQRGTSPVGHMEMKSAARPPLRTQALGAFSLLVGAGLAAIVLLAEGVSIAHRAALAIVVLVSTTQGWAHIRGSSAVRTTPPIAWWRSLRTYGIGLTLVLAWVVAFDLSPLAADVLGASSITAAVVVGAYVIWLVLSTIRWGIAVWRG